MPELPNYFLADLPPEAAVTPAMLAEACLTLQRNREKYLAPRSTQSLIALLSGVASEWLQTDFPFRRLALEQGPALTGFPERTLERGLDSFFRQLTRDNLQQLVVQDLGHVQRLDRLVATDVEQRQHGVALARGPEFLVHITAGNIPNPALMSMVLGFLCRSAQFIKCGRNASFLPRLFAHSLYQADAKLCSCLELAEWPGGRTELETILYQHASCVTATGADETLDLIQKELPAHVRFLRYGHKVSFAYITQRALANIQPAKLALRAADDIVAWNQLGCLSPHVIYVEGNSVYAEQFAQALAEELARRETLEPRGPLSASEAAVIAVRRDFYRIRSDHSSETRMWSSQDSTAWTVVYEADPLFQNSCLHRFIYVKSVAHLEHALQQAHNVHGQVSTVGLAAEEESAWELTAKLAAWGVTRVCPLGQMQSPPLTWRHDGRPALGDLITWTQWERERTQL